MTSRRIFITGSADGLGQLAARRLAEQGHQVVLHARNPKRAREALSNVPKAEGVLVANLSRLEEVKRLAEEANLIGPFDAVIHNAGVYQASSQELLIVNTLAPYVLTCLMHRPERLIYISSDLHLHGRADLTALASERISYADSKFYVVLLAKAVARRWSNVYANAVDPGWVPTKMGGPHAPDDLDKGVETQVWLAASEDEKAKVSGRYFHHRQEAPHHPLADDIGLQDAFLDICAKLTGIPLVQGGIDTSDSN